MTIFYYVVYSWLSKVNNDHALEGTWYQQRCFWYMFAWGLFCPIWLIVSRISKNITFDGMLYDNLMFITFVTTMMALGQGNKFLTHQWIGLALIVMGSILLRIEFKIF